MSNLSSSRTNLDEQVMQFARAAELPEKEMEEG